MSRTEEATLKDIAEGIYVKWEVTKPPKLQEYLDYLTGKRTAKILDSDLIIETDSTKTTVSIYRNSVTLSSIELESGETIQLSEFFDLANYSDKKSFAADFYDVWRRAVRDSEY